MADRGEDRESGEEEILRMEDVSLLQATSQEVIEFKVIAQLNTDVEVNYYRNGGILHTVLRNLVK